MGILSSKENLYAAIEQEDMKTIEDIVKVCTSLIQQDPNLLNKPMSDDCTPLFLNSGLTLPLARAAWRNSLPVAELLLEMGANLDLTGPTTITPLMWACIRGHEEMAGFLMKKGASVDIESRMGLNALDYCVLNNRYALAVKLIETEKLPLRNPDFYTEIALDKEMSVGKYDYSLMIAHLHEKTDPNHIPSFIKKTEEKVFMDPVIDPRETWSAFFKRVIEFEEPPLIEREELPPGLQPQNRALGKLSMYLEGVTGKQDIKRQDISEEKKLTNQEISMEASRDIRLQTNPIDIEMMVEERKE